MNKVKIGLALGSGSARGLAHIGVLKVLERAGISVDFISGTSIGALIGGVFAAGITSDEMENIALSVDFKKLISLADIAVPSTAFVNGERVESFIQEIIGRKNFDQLLLPFACIAADVLSGREVILQRGDVTRAIRASISTPIIFAPVKEGDKLLVDGGVINPVPVDVVKRIGADVVIAVTLTGIPDGRPRFHNKRRESVEADEMRKPGFPEIFYSRVVNKVKEKFQPPTVYQVAVRSIDLMQRELSIPKLKMADIVIAPQVNGIPFYSFHEAEKVIVLGEKAAEEAIPDIERFIEDNQ